MMTTEEKMMTTEEKIADRAAELISQSHILPERHADLEHKHEIALSALNKLQDQRDHLAAQLKDAEALLARAGDLLRATKVWAETFGGVKEFVVLMDNINGYLDGEVLPPAAPKPEGK